MVVQWWEHSPPTNVAWVWISALTPYVGWVLLLVLSLAPRDFSSGTPVSPLLKKPTSPHSNSIWTHFSKFLRTPKCSKLIAITIKNGTTDLGKWKQVYLTWQSLMLLLKCLLPWQLLVLPQIKHVHVVSEHQKQAENQEKVYWTNPWSWSLAFFLDCQQYYFLLCFHLRFKYKGKEDFAIRNVNFSTTKPQSAGLCLGGDCGPYKWLTFEKLLDCLQFF